MWRTLLFIVYMCNFNQIPSSLCYYYRSIKSQSYMIDELSILLLDWTITWKSLFKIYIKKRRLLFSTRAFSIFVKKRFSLITAMHFKAIKGIGNCNTRGVDGYSNLMYYSQLRWLVATIPRQLNRDEMLHRPRRLTAAIIFDIGSKNSRRVDVDVPARKIQWKITLGACAKPTKRAHPMKLD